MDGASLERIAVSNIVMANIESPIFVRLGNRGRAQATPHPEFLGGISISDIVATGARRASSITGIPGFPVRRITLANICITAIGGGTAELARKEVPELESKYPDADMFDDLPAYGLFCRQAEALVLDNVHFHLEQPDARPAVILDSVEDLDLRALSVAPPSSNEPALALQDVRRCFIHGMRAQAGTKTLFKLSGSQSAQLQALGNDFTEASAAFQVGPEVGSRALRQESNLLPSLASGHFSHAPTGVGGPW